MRVAGGALELLDVAALHAGRHGLDATSAGVQYLVASAGNFDVRNVAQLDEPAVGAAQRQRGHFVDAVAVRRFQHDHQVGDLVAAEDLRGRRAFIRRLHCFQNGQRLQAERGEALMAQANRQLRCARLCLNLDVTRARYFGEFRGNRQRVTVQQVERRAVEIHHERRGVTGDGFLDALGQEGVDREGHARKSAAALPRERIPDFLQDAHLFLARQRTDLDFELAVMRAERVRAVLRSADPLRHRLDAFDRADRLRYLLADTQGLRFRRTRHRRHVHDVVALAQRRNELPGKQRQQADADCDDDAGHADHASRDNARSGRASTDTSVSASARMADLQPSDSRAASSR